MDSRPVLDLIAAARQGEGLTLVGIGGQARRGRRRLRALFPGPRSSRRTSSGTAKASISIASSERSSRHSRGEAATFASSTGPPGDAGSEPRANRRGDRRGRLRPPSRAPRRLCRSRLGRGALRGAARARGRRDREEARPHLGHVWIPSEDRYLKRDDPVGCADLIIQQKSESPPTVACTLHEARLRGAVACAAPRRCRAPRRSSGRPSSATTGVGSLTDDDVKTFVGSREAAQAGGVPPRRLRPAPRGRAQRGCAPSPGRMPVSSDGVSRISPSRHQMFVTGPSSTMPSASTKPASSAPRDFASDSAAIATA